MLASWSSVQAVYGFQCRSTFAPRSLAGRSPSCPRATEGRNRGRESRGHVIRGGLISAPGGIMIVPRAAELVAARYTPAHQFTGYNAACERVLMLPGPSIDARWKFIVIRNPDPVRALLNAPERTPSRATLFLYFYQIRLMSHHWIILDLTVLYKTHKYSPHQNLFYACIKSIIFCVKSNY